MAERWLPVDETAAHFGVNPCTICKWMPPKVRVARKLGRPWKFLALKVDQWVKKAVSSCWWTKLNFASSKYQLRKPCHERHRNWDSISDLGARIICVSLHLAAQSGSRFARKPKTIFR